MNIEIIEQRLAVVRLWDENKISYGEAVQRLMPLGFDTIEDAIAYLSAPGASILASAREQKHYD